MTDDVDVSGDVVVRTGRRDDIQRLPPELLPPGRREALEARLDADEVLIVGEVDGRIASCAWLRRGGDFALDHLPEHRFRLGESAAHGYDVWTDPALRDRGIRRAVLAEELRILEFLGAAWEVSAFAEHQLDGVRRNLARIGVPLIPLWKMAVRPGGAVSVTSLSADGRTATPCFDDAVEEARVAGEAR